jgi:hypothetical protein
MRHHHGVRRRGAEAPDGRPEQLGEATVVGEALLRGAVGEVGDEIRQGR